MLPEQAQRQTAMYIAFACYKMGLSQQQFLDAVEMWALPYIEDNDACWELKLRGELEHLVTWVWTFRKR